MPKIQKKDPLLLQGVLWDKINHLHYSGGIGKILKRSLFSFHSFEPGIAAKSTIQFFDQVIDRFVQVVAGTRNGYGRPFEFKVSLGGKLVFVR